VAESLAPAAREGSWLTVGPLAPGVRLRSDDAILRIGNAAGEAHPIIGEGMSMALQSAFLLCAQLLAVPAGAARTQGGVAQRYAAQWRGQFVPRMWLANALAHMAMHPTTAAALMSATHLWPGLFGLGARWGGKLHHAADLSLFLPMAVPRASALPIH
jgi:2-polyprenyl-6-methoxyphenol hydroxylase-like FAD-dependent oxidoreductase